MATNKRDLRAYVRYDGNQRVIPGSLVLRRSKPKVGDWKEIQTYECCDSGGCVGLYAIALYPRFTSPDLDSRAYYTDRDLQNIAGQCADPTLAVGAKLYMDNLGTIPVADGQYRAVDGNAILFNIQYTVVNGIITDAGCP